MFDYARRLAQLGDAHLLRRRRVVESAQGTHLTVDGRRLLAFCSNDYLGLANHPNVVAAAERALRDYGVGASASALISGHMHAHAQLETALARFVGLPRALFFSSGYMASIGVIPALVEPGDAIFSDQLNHACLIDGIRLARAQRHIYPHADTARLASLLAASSAPRKLVVSDAVFSMDGDIAPVAELVALCERHDALLLLDDAHGFGVLGANGAGVLAHLGISSKHVLYLGTLGKAAGVFGAFVAGQDDVIEWLTQRSRSYVFSTNTPPAIAAALLASLQVITEEPARRQHLQRLADTLKRGAADLPWPLLPSVTAIQPLVVGSNQRALELMAALLEQDIWVPAIRPPTVPEGTARLRISLSAAHTEADVHRLIDALHQVSKRS